MVKAPIQIREISGSSLIRGGHGSLFFVVKMERLRPPFKIEEKKLHLLLAQTQLKKTWNKQMEKKAPTAKTVHTIQAKKPKKKKNSKKQKSQTNSGSSNHLIPTLQASQLI